MKILFFSPYNYIDLHSIPEAIVANSLANDGHDIIRISCAGIYKKFCISMSASGLTEYSPQEEKGKVCHRCREINLSIIKKFRFRSTNLDYFLTEEDLIFITEELKGVNSSNWKDYCLNEIPTGRYAAYEFLLNNKINSNIFTDDQLRRYKIYLSGALKTQIAGYKIFSQFAPDRLVLYNYLYSTNRIMSALAEKFNAPSFTIHAGNNLKHRLQELTISKVSANRIPLSRSPSWNDYSGYPLTKNRIDRAYDHILELITAKSNWVYSLKPKGTLSTDLRKYFSIHPDQKVILVTLSSLDEIYAGAISDSISPTIPNAVFKSHIEWIEFLLEYSEKCPNIVFIFRPHPRLFPNKREDVTSPSIIELESIFCSPPKNVRINWPSDNISLFDIIKVADVGLNSTSSSGLEMMLLGIPVVGYLQSETVYPRNLSSLAVDKSDYIKKIENALIDGFNLNCLYEIYRWISFQSDVASIDISDGYQAKPSFLKRALSKLYRIFNIIKIPSINKQFSNLNNSVWLTMAIIENLESHIDIFIQKDNKSHNFSYDAGMNIILDNFLATAELIGKNDSLYMDKISLTVQRFRSIS